MTTHGFRQIWRYAIYASTGVLNVSKVNNSKTQAV